MMCLSAPILKAAPIAQQIAYYGQAEYEHIHDLVPWPDMAMPLSLVIRNSSVWLILHLWQWMLWLITDLNQLFKTKTLCKTNAACLE